ncbi:4935_t:CDS:2, partial [Paraglomus brasilianum]
MMDNVDPQEYEEFAAEYRANNHDAKDGEIILASLHRNKNSKVMNIHAPPKLYPESAQELAGCFCKSGGFLSFSGKSSVDMHLDEHPTPMGKKLVELFQKTNNFNILISFSGAGKTQAIFNVAMQNRGVFLMYIECKVEVVGEPTSDCNFAQLYEDIETVDNTTGLQNNDGKAEACHLISLEYTSWIFYLILLIRKIKDLTPHSYLPSQLNSGQESIAEIKSSLNIESKGNLDKLFQVASHKLSDILPHGSQLAIAIDKASTASKLFYPKFHNIHGNPCGLLTPMLEFLIPSRKIPVVIAGTLFTLKHGDKVESDVGKTTNENVIMDFETLTIDKVKAYIKHYLNLSGCDIGRIEDWKYLAGCPCLAAQLLCEIVQGENHEQNETKQTVLENVFISCHFFSGIGYVTDYDDKLTCLVECGIASLRQTQSVHYIQVNEPLAIRVVNTVLGIEFKSPAMTLTNRLFAKLNKHANASDMLKGKAWEYLILAQMLTYNGKKVIDLIKLFYNDYQILQLHQKPNEDSLKVTELPEWTYTATFNVESYYYGDVEMLSLLCNKSYEDGVDVISDWLASPENQKYILQPENEMCPDGLYIDGHHSHYWTLLFSAKFYSNA